MKRFIALLVALIVLLMSILNAPSLRVQAAAPMVFPLASELVHGLMTIFGYSSGLGNSVNGLTSDFNDDMFKSYAETWDAGGTVTLGSGYELPDLRDEANFLRFLTDVRNLTLAYGIATDEDSVLDAGLMGALNLKSYKATGSLATKTFTDILNKAIELYAGSATLQDDLDTAFAAFSDDAAVSSIRDFGAASQIFNALMTALICVSAKEAGNTWINPVESEYYNEYDLYKASFIYNEVEYLFYNTSQLEFVSRDKTELIRISFSQPVYCLPLVEEQSYAPYMRLYVAHSSPYTMTVSTYSLSNGSYISGTTYNSFSKNGLQCLNRAEYISAAYFPYTVLKVDGNHVNSAFCDTVNANYYGKTSYIDNGASIYENAADLSPAIDDFYERNITAADVVYLADALEDTAAASVGTETAVDDVVITIQTAAQAIPKTEVDTGENAGLLAQIIGAITGIGDKILTLPQFIWNSFEDVLEAIKTYLAAIAGATARPWEGDNGDQSTDILDLLNGLILLIMILFKLLMIFIHCLQFIINIFSIPASTAFLPDEVIMGLDYLKSLEITGLGLSVYDFLMGLVYILIVFFAIRLLRVNIDRIRLPKIRNGGMS